MTNDTLINPSIFKAYDVRGLYPQEVNEDAARLIGRGFVAFLNAKRIAVSRDMRLSSPSLAAAFIDGSIVWPNGWIGPEASLHGSVLGRNVHVGRNVIVKTPAVLGDKTVITDYSHF